MANILVIRLSAIGDVAMTVPVIYSAAKANPTDSFTVLTQAFLIPVFINRPKNVNVIGINTKSTEKTLAGLLRFASALVKYDFDVVLDLHDVLRTMIIRTLFRLNGRRVFVVDKARKDRARLTDAKHKRFKQLRPVIERYADVFRNAGLHYTESFTSLYETSTPDLSALEPLVGTKTGKWIGIAPFAKHRGKIYPTGEMELVMAELSDREDFTIFLFGGRGYEEALLDQWAFEYPRVKSVAGKYSLDQELALISRLDLLIRFLGRYTGAFRLGRYPSLCRILRISSGSGRLYPVGLTLPSLFRIRPKALPAEGLGVYETAQSGSNHKQGINLFK